MESSKRTIIRDKLLYGPEPIIPKGQRGKLALLESLAAKMMALLDIETEDDNALILQANELLSELCKEHEDKNILLALLQGALVETKIVHEARVKIRRALEEELSDLKDAYKDELTPIEMRRMLDNAKEDAQIALSRSPSKVLRELPVRSATALESAYICEVVQSTRRNIDSLCTGFMTGLGISKDSVYASIVNVSIGKAGKTVVDVLNELRDHDKQKSVEKPSMLESPYEFLSNPSDESFLDGLRSTSERQWIFGITLLIPVEHRTEARTRAANLLGRNPQQLHSQSAYLTGALWEAAKAKKTAIFNDAMVIYNYIDSKKGVQKTPEEEPKQASGELVTPVTLEPNGDTFDYDNPIKRAWRAIWFRYVAEHTQPAERPNLRVACLPGRFGLEIPGYLELGFRPSNIVGFEGSTRVHKEFFEMAGRYGIQAVGEKLGEALPKINVPFDVVNLDFTTTIQDESAVIFRNLLCGNRAVCAVNVLGKRDADISKSMLALFSKRLELNQNPIHGGIFSTSEIKSLNEDAEQSTNKDTYAVADSRKKGLPFLVAESLGQMRVENWLNKNLLLNFPGYRDGKWQEFHVVEVIEKAIAQIADAIGIAYSELYPSSIRFDPDFQKQLTGYTNQTYSTGVLTTFRTMETTDLRHLRYISPNKSPFHTILATKERPVDVYRRFEDVGHFFTDVCMNMLKGKTSSDSGHIFLSRRKGKKISPGIVINNPEQLHLIYSSPRINHQIKLIRLDEFRRAIGPITDRSVIKKSFNPGFEIPIEEISCK